MPQEPWHSPSTGRRDSSTRLESILNLPEQDYPAYSSRVIYPVRKNVAHVESDFAPINAPSDQFVVPIEWNGISARASGNKSTGYFSLFLSPSLSFFFVFSEIRTNQLRGSVKRHAEPNLRAQSKRFRCWGEAGGDRCYIVQPVTRDVVSLAHGRKHSQLCRNKMRAFAT